MTAEEREAILQQSRYEGTFTIGRGMISMGIINPSIDSAVIASAAKDNGLSFLSAVNNGGIYQNRTIMGGNAIFGSGPTDLIPGVKQLKGRASKGSQIFKFGNMSMNYLPESAMEASGMTKETMSLAGIKNVDHVIETGIGFSKNFSPFFQTLSEQGFTTLPNNRSGAISLLETTGKYSSAQLDSMRKGFKGSEGYIKQELAKFLEARDTGRTFANDAQRMKYYASEAAELYGDVNVQAGMIKTHLIKGGSKEIQSAFNAHVQGLDFGDAKKLAGDLGIITGKRVSSSHVKAVEYYSKKVAIVDNMLTTANGKNIASYLSKAEIKELALALGHKEKNVSQFYYALKRGKVNIDEKFKTAFNSIGSIKSLKETLGTTTKTVTNELKDDIIKAAGKEFFEKTAFQTFMSSTPMKILSGNLVSGALGMPLAVATGAVSTLSSMHQTAAINNFARLANYRRDSIDDMRSEEGSAATYGHKKLSYSNQEDLGYVMNMRNVAEKYIRQIDEIEIDSSESKLSSFTTM